MKASPGPSKGEECLAEKSLFNTLNGGIGQETKSLSQGLGY